MISVHRITNRRGQTLVVETDIVEVRENALGEHVLDGDMLDGPVVGHFLRWGRLTIDGEPASRRRVGQFIRRARESIGRRGT